jgi:hypothetical protein
MDLRSLSEDAPESQWRDPLRDKVGAEQLHHCTTQTGGSGRPCGMPRWPSVVGGTRRRRSSPWSCGGTRPSIRRVIAEGSRVLVVGRLQQRSWTAEDGSARSWKLWLQDLGPSTAGDERGDCRGDDLALLCFPMSVRKEVYEEPRRHRQADWPGAVRSGGGRDG